MKSKKYWGLGYLEEMARNQANVMINGFSEEGIVKFLLKRGFTVEEILKEAKSVRKVIDEHNKGLTHNHAREHRHRSRDKAN